MSKSPGHGRTLRLTTGDLTDPPVGHLTHAEPVQHLGGSAPCGARPRAGQPQRQFDVLPHGQLGDQVAKLKDETDPMQPDSRPLSVAEEVDALAVQLDSALVGTQQP